MKTRMSALHLVLTLLTLLVGANAVNLAAANPGPISQIVPVVKMPDMQVNAAISRVNGSLWARVDADYKMNTVKAFGDKWQVENYGFSLSVNPSQTFVTVTVAYDRLDAQYPVPLNTTNMSVKVEGAELDCNLTNRKFHFFDANLPEIHWKISPVPGNFSIITHYEHPIPPINETYTYLGEYAFVFPLGARFGLQEVIDYAYNENPWLGHSTTIHFSVNMEQAFTNLQAYSISNRGHLTPLNYTLATEGSTQRMNLAFPGVSSGETTTIFGFVLVFDSPKESSEPSQTIIIGSVATSATVAAGLLVYLKKRKH